MSGQWEGGKGSKQRKTGDQNKFDSNWDAIFGKKETKKSEKASKPDWTDDKFYEDAWSWVDECELEEEDKQKDYK